MSRPARQTALVLAALAALTCAVYLPVWNAGFVSDDLLYVRDNPGVLSGLTRASVLRAFSEPVAANWHPLTMLSLMLDAELFGPEPRGFHLMNVFYHFCAAALAFLALRRLTGAGWRSALVAALFAAHPVHVESVAWISERKDVLSGVFFWLALGAYGRFTERPAAGRQLLVFALLVAGLTAKPMLVTLPLLFLVLDGWPLGRLRGVPGSRLALVTEKLPWLAASAAFAVVTLVVQARGHALQTLESLPFSWRVQNALLSYVRYLADAFWPERLRFFHPFPAHPPGAAATAAILAALTAVTLLAVAARRRRPAFTAGWLWFLGLLVPVIGLVQVGGQTHADRYLYLPLTGVWLAAIWPTADLLRERRLARVLAVSFSVAAVVSLAAAAHAQARLWESGVSLYASSLARGGPGEAWLAHYGLGTAYSGLGDRTRAEQHYRESIRIRPDWAGSRYNYGMLMLKQGRPAEALEQYREAIRMAPGDPRGHYGEGLALAAMGRDEEALGSYRAALALNPAHGPVYTDLGVAAARRGRLSEAESAFREAARLLAGDELPHYNLGLALAAQGRHREAVDAFVAAVRLRADFAEAHNDLGVSLAAEGRRAEAERAFLEALRLRPDLAAARDNLARERAGQGVRR